MESADTQVEAPALETPLEEEPPVPLIGVSDK